MTKHLILASLQVLLLLASTTAVPLGAQAVAVPAATVDADPIQPGDLIRLTVHRDKDISGEYPVNEFGTVVLPLVGEYDVTRETRHSLREKVVRALQEIRFGPDIELVVLSRVRILGEVQEPGIYSVDPTMTLADAIALAHGATDNAKARRVELRRNGQTFAVDLRSDTIMARSPMHSGDEIELMKRSWLARNAPTALGFLTASVGLALSAFR